MNGLDFFDLLRTALLLHVHTCKNPFEGRALLFKNKKLVMFAEV